MPDTPDTPFDISLLDQSEWPEWWENNLPWNQEPDLKDLLRLALSGERAEWDRGGQTFQWREEFLRMLQARWRSLAPKPPKPSSTEARDQRLQEILLAYQRGIGAEDARFEAEERAHAEQSTRRAEEWARMDAESARLDEQGRAADERHIAGLDALGSRLGKAEAMATNQGLFDYGESSDGRTFKQKVIGLVEAFAGVGIGIGGTQIDSTPLSLFVLFCGLALIIAAIWKLNLLENKSLRKQRVFNGFLTCFGAVLLVLLWSQSRPKAAPPPLTRAVLHEELQAFSSPTQPVRGLSPTPLVSPFPKAMPSASIDPISTRTLPGSSDAVPTHFNRVFSIEGGAAQRLSALLTAAGYTGSMQLQELQVGNYETNESTLYLGSSSDVNASNGVPLLPAESDTQRASSPRDLIDANQIYLFLEKPGKIFVILRSR